jgi:hypothetical protein
MSAPTVEEKLALSNGLEASVSGDQLAIVGADLNAIPSDLSQYAKGIKK